MVYIKAMKKECEACGGSGQIGYFQGESRFIITWDECLECNGTGIMEHGDEVKVPESAPHDAGQSSSENTKADGTKDKRK